jgi:hypothetical protein
MFFYGKAKLQHGTGCTKCLTPNEELVNTSASAQSPQLVLGLCSEQGIQTELFMKRTYS